MPAPASDAARTVVDAISRWRRLVGTPLVVAIDGHGAAGKSTLAELVAAELGAALIHVDDFWRGASAAATGPPREGDGLAAYYDWSRLRAQALAPLMAGTVARFLAADPDSERTTTRVVEPAPVIVVEGVSAASPALADLVTRTVLVETPEDVRLARLRAHVPAEDWDERWLDAERRYLATRPPASFDLVVSGAAAA